MTTSRSSVFSCSGGSAAPADSPSRGGIPSLELLNGLLFLWAFTEFGLTGEGILVMALCSSLLVITFIDLDHQIIPDVITLPGMIIGLAAAPFFMTALAGPLSFGLEKVIPHAGPYLTALLNSFMGLLLGAAPLNVIGLLWEKLRKVEAMGGGDVKLMGMVGSFLGWKGAFLTIMLGPRPCAGTASARTGGSSHVDAAAGGALPLPQPGREHGQGAGAALGAAAGPRASRRSRGTSPSTTSAIPSPSSATTARRSCASRDPDHCP